MIEVSRTAPRSAANCSERSQRFDVDPGQQIVVALVRIAIGIAVAEEIDAGRRIDAPFENRLADIEGDGILRAEVLDAIAVGAIRSAVDIQRTG